MKDDTSTPTPDGLSSPNEFERDKPGTNALSDAEAAIEALRQRGGVFVDAVRATRMPMVLTDPNLPGNPIVFANPSFLKLSGYSMDEVLGQQPHFMNGPATDPNDAARFAEALRSDHDDINETVQYRKDGSRFVATVLLSAFKDAEGRTLNHFMSWLDVTRRVDAEGELADLREVQTRLRESEAALRQTERRRDSALLAAEMGTWDYDLVADVCHFDARAQELYNLPSDQLDHRPEGVASVVHPDDVGPMFDEIQRASNPDGEGRYDMVYRIARPDGTYRCLRAVGITEFEGTGKSRRAVRIVGASRDITLEREAETALRESEARLAEDLASTQALASAGEAMIDTSREAEAEAAILAAAVAIMNADAASLQRLDPETGDLVLLGHVGFHPASAAFWKRVGPASGGTCGRALGELRRTVVEDVAEDPILSKSDDLTAYIRSGIVAVQSTPLVTRSGELVGMISTHWKHRHRPDARQFTHFDVLARQAADLIQRRAAEEALRASEERFAQFAASTTDVLWVRDADTMALEYISPAFESVFGMTTGAVEGGIEPGARLIDPADRERVIVHLDAARRGEPQIYEFRIVHGSNGGPRWIRDHCFPLIDKTGVVQRIGGIARDVTELKLAEEARRAIEERQAFLLKLSDALRPLSDAAAIQSATARLVGEYLGTDRSMYAEVEGEQGFETGTIRGQYVRRGELDAAPIEPFPDHFTFADFGGHTMAQRYRGEPLVVSDIDSAPGFEPEEREAWRAANVRAALVIELVKEGRLVAEFGVHCATAREWTDADISLMTDVAERTWAAAERAQTEEALRDSERLRVAMLDVLPLGLALVNREGEVLLSNSEWSRFVPADRIPSADQERVTRWRSWDDRGDPIEPANYPGARALRGERVVPAIDFLYADESGAEIWTSVGAVPLLDERGEITGAVCFIQDIDAAKRAQEALRDSERHAQTLLAELQHRVRNSLAVVRSIARRTAENSRTVEDMLAHFQGRLDAFSRVQAAVTRNPGGTVNLKSLVEDELVAHATHQGNGLSIKGPEVELDPKTAERLSLAIHELTTNAVKHGALSGSNAGNGGTINVRWSLEQADGKAGRLLFRWDESGIEVENVDPKREGFGMELLRRSLPYDLQAETEVQLRREGLHFELKMPLGPGK